jgi:CHAD domain-containing protein/CYTH domain-containing protein
MTALTKLTPVVTDLPAMVAARILAQSYLDQADEARKRVLADADDEALHDFRVAVRRLRSSVRAYRAQLDDTVRRRHRRWLRRMTESTNESRDLEVQLAWLGKRRRLDETQQRGIDWLATRLREQMWGARAEALRTIRHDFPTGRDDLRPVLGEYRADVDPARPQPPSCGEVTGATVLVLTARLDAQLGMIQAPDAAVEAHQARITGKRLRYLLEPFEFELIAGRSLIQKLKKLQDTLGDFNDRSELMKRIVEERKALETEEPQSPAIGDLTAVLALANAERDVLYLRVQRRWQEREARPLGELLRGASSQLLAHHAADGLEIERKFLLHSLPRLARTTGALQIDQGWLPGERLLERIRRVRGPNGTTRWYRTVKSGAGVQRQEIEEETTEPVFRALWRLTRGRRLSKRRYCIPDGDLVWEIDRFTGGKLILAEVEVPSAATPLEPPAWLRNYIVREVTGEPAYLNVNLAT